MKEEHMVDVCYQQLLVATDKLVGEGADPLAVAAVLSQLSLKIYKTVMSEDEFDRICTVIYESRLKTTPLVEFQTLQ